MYRHRALPKDLSSSQNKSVSIKKLSSPKTPSQEQKAEFPTTNEKLSNSRQPSTERKRIHLIASKEKPRFQSSREKISLNHNLKEVIAPYSIAKITPFNLDDRNERSAAHSANFQSMDTKMSRVKNTITQVATFPLPYADLNLIQSKYWTFYEGECVQPCIRHGFGTQYFSNGEKFVGWFFEGNAHGQGTFYSGKSKAYLGMWENNRMLEVIAEMKI